MRASKSVTLYIFLQFFIILQLHQAVLFFCNFFPLYLFYALLYELILQNYTPCNYNFMQCFSLVYSLLKMLRPRSQINILNTFKKLKRLNNLASSVNREVAR